MVDSLGDIREVATVRSGSLASLNTGVIEAGEAGIDKYFAVTAVQHGDIATGTHQDTDVPAQRLHRDLFAGRPFSHRGYKGSAFFFSQKIMWRECGGRGGEAGISEKEAMVYRRLVGDSPFVGVLIIPLRS
jgi:hypothetical protein